MSGLLSCRLARVLVLALLGLIEPALAKHRPTMPVDAPVTPAPLTRTGLLQFEMPDGGGACTASVIDRRLLLTAGHCVYDPVRRVFFHHFRFTPAAFEAPYDDGVSDIWAPLGTWTVARVAITPEWRAGDFAADFAVLLTVDSSDGAVGDRIGHYHLARPEDIPADPTVLVLGYPENIDAGTRLEVLRAHTWIEPKVGYAKPYPLRAAVSRFGEGASGGPWLVGIDDPATASPVQATIVGVTSTGTGGNRVYSSLIGQSVVAARDGFCDDAAEPANCYPAH